MGFTRLKFFRKNLNKFLLQKKGIFDLDFPADFYIETSSACNLKCPACPRTYSDRARENMNEFIFRKVIEEISSNRPDLERLGFHFFGEPLLNPRFFDFVELARNYLPNTTLGVSSNANLLSSEKIDELLDSALDSFGIWPDTIVPEQYNVFRAGGSLKKVEESIKELLKKRRRRNREDIEIHIGIIIYRDNMHLVEDFVKKWKSICSKYKNVYIYTSESNDWAGQVPSDNLLISVKKSKLQIKTFCAMPFFMCIVSASGDVTPCCYDCNLNLSWGNIKDYSIKNMWNSPKASALRERLLTASISSSDLCYRCRNYKRDIFGVLRALPGGTRIFRKKYDKYDRVLNISKSR